MPSIPGDALRFSARYAFRSRSSSTWCSSAVNRSCFWLFARSRTRSSPWATLPRLSVRCVQDSPAFPLAGRLRSIDSAPDPSGLFADFIATVQPSDFCGSFIIGFGSSPSRCGPLHHLAMTYGQPADLPVPVQRVSVHARFYDHAGSSERSRWRTQTSCLPLHRQRRHPEIVFFRGSMAGLHVPLPTLRRPPHKRLRTARGRCSSLLLHRSGLAPPTPCRSPGAPV